MNHLSLDVAQFIENHWQQQPVLIKAAFSDFEDPICPDELAGLALEETTSARMIYTKEDGWLSQQGAPEDYSPLGDDNWQLLVQAINHYVDEADQLAEQFSFLPQWRFDDVMASFAVAGGGVGPHIDNYDVFIIQGQGRRHWKVGPRGNYAPRNDNSDMKLVEDFVPIIDEVMEPGDLLYIPVGFPHCGRSTEPSMSYSVGFRAPSQQELLAALADVLVDNDMGNTRYQQPDHSSNHNATINASQQFGLAAMVSQTLTGDAWHQALGSLLSQNRFELALEPAEHPLSSEQLVARLQAGETLYRLLGLKCLKIEGDPNNRLYLDGQSWQLPAAMSESCEQLTMTKELVWTDLAELCNAPESLKRFTDLVNEGYWYFDTEMA